MYTNTKPALLSCLIEGEDPEGDSGYTRRPLTWAEAERRLNLL